MHSLQVRADALFNGLLLTMSMKIQTIQLLAFNTVTLLSPCTLFSKCWIKTQRTAPADHTVVEK